MVLDGSLFEKEQGGHTFALEPHGGATAGYPIPGIAHFRHGKVRPRHPLPHRDHAHHSFLVAAGKDKARPPWEKGMAGPLQRSARSWSPRSWQHPPNVPHLWARIPCPSCWMEPMPQGVDGENIVIILIVPLVSGTGEPHRGLGRLFVQKRTRWPHLFTRTAWSGDGMLPHSWDPTRPTMRQN